MIIYSTLAAANHIDSIINLKISRKIIIIFTISNTSLSCYFTIKKFSARAILGPDRGLIPPTARLTRDTYNS